MEYPLSLALLLLFWATCAWAKGPNLAAYPLSGTLKFDGILSEAAWQKAPSVTLTQQSPNPGVATPFITKVQVLASADALYFGFTCVDPDPSRIAIHTLKRDGNVFGDDLVSVVLDTFNDHRTGYIFEINAAGARIDGLVSGSDFPSLEWDGIWDGHAAKIPGGWSAVIRIPASTLSFARGADSWGANFSRDIPRNDITERWSSPVLNADFTDLNRAGTLSGVAGLRQGRGLTISPYATGRSDRTYGVGARTWGTAEGGDLTWRMTPQLTTSLTLNTDFAETEVDSRQINLTRFSNFFPEKRAFFLEGANQFNFGGGLGRQFIPFFSRSIGLLDGHQIPINAGLKLNGRVGRLNLAVLDVETRRTLLTPTEATDLGLPSTRLPANNMLAGRISYDLNPELRVGTIFTHGDPRGLRSNTLAGVDAVWRTSTFRGDKNLVFSAWSATTQGDHLSPGSHAGWGAMADYPNDLLDCSVSINQYGTALEPLLGFLPRPGTRQSHARCSVQPRPSEKGAFGWIRQAFFQNELNRTVNASGVLESWQYSSSPINLRLVSGDRFELHWNPQGETLTSPFEISPGVIIPSGSYTFAPWRVEVHSSDRRMFQLDSETRFGAFYNGNLTQQQSSLKWTSPTGQIQLSAHVESDFAHLPVGKFVTRLYRTQATYAWTPDLVLSSFIQYDNDSQNLGTNTRLRWTVKPGNDLFVVWNHGWQRLPLRPNLSLIPLSDALTAKIRWTFRN